MLVKIIAIKNVGRFRSSAGQAVQQLCRNVMVLGANGYGKTTLCAILRSLQTGDSDYIAGRRTLGCTGSSEVSLLTSAGNVQFGASGWTRTMPEFLIFDSAFVAQNVHAGDVVDLEQKRNLYRVIIGQDGIGFAEEDSRLAAESRAKAGEITAAAKGLQTHVPVGMKLEEFLKLSADPDIDTRIAEQAKTLEAVRQSEQLKARAALAEISLPTLPASLSTTLARTVEDIAEDTELRVAAHLAAHRMTDHGEAWLAEGMPFIADDKCPFCGQGLKNVSLIGAYRALFSKAYEALKNDIASLRGDVERDFGDRAIGLLTTQNANNVASLEFWRRYCTIAPVSYDMPGGLPETLSGLRDAVLALLDRKAQAPLEAVDERADARFMEQHARLDQAEAAIRTTNAAIRAANIVIAAMKAATAGGDVATADTALKRLAVIKKRHEAAVAEASTAYGKLEGEKSDIETRKAAARAKLEEHSNKVVKPYERRINELLDDFNAGFGITKTKYTYPGGQATSSYQLVINNEVVDLGDGKTAASKPSFKNTLSAGDRTTLALAFFLASLERDPTRAGRIVVFDDPFNSQDAFRRHQTVYHIKRTGGLCSQVLILSHDAGFLRQIWDKCPSDQRIAIQLTDHLAFGTKIGPCDLEEACKGRVATEVDDLLKFIHTGSGRLHDLIKKMRVVLETFCRATYPGSFEPNDMLGDIVRKIREGGDQHPAAALLDSLDQINDYSRDHHHGEDPKDGVSDQIDSRELAGYVRKTLKISNNLQA
jgi:wobble nucleotide-excising tRNase